MSSNLPLGQGHGARSAAHDGSLPQPNRSPVATDLYSPLSRTEGERVSEVTNRQGYKSPRASGQSTIRSITPEPAEEFDAGTDTNMAQASQHSRGYGTTSPQTSPGSRQGMVFNETFRVSHDSSDTNPRRHSRTSLVQQHTHAMEGPLALRQQPTASSVESRPRVGSLSSSGSTPYAEAAKTSLASSRLPDLKITISSSSQKDKKSQSAVESRFTNRTSSRPTSPMTTSRPSVDCFPSPIPTNEGDAVILILLMKLMGGRAKGDVEYQAERGGPWYSGLCQIDQVRGSLHFNQGHSETFNLPIVADLRGCRVFPVDHPEKGECLELGDGRTVLILRPKGPVLDALLDINPILMWLAALLPWQQLPRPAGNRMPGTRGNISPVPPRGDLRRRGSAAPGSGSGTPEATAKSMLWDKGTVTSPLAVVKRPCTRDMKGATTSWKEISMSLQANGDFKLIFDDTNVIAVIELSQLSRNAVQRLDKSVLDVDFCIAIFPTYTPTSTQVSIYRPVYLSLPTRASFESWFVLLRAYTVPGLHYLDPADGKAKDIIEFDNDFDFEGQLFRLEKTMEVRVTEAKLRNAPGGADVPQHNRRGRGERDLVTGNYFAEVILDGEVRARTTTQRDTKTPFWREAVQFTELDIALPLLSVHLKRVEGDMDRAMHKLQAHMNTPIQGGLTEIDCGSVDIQLDNLDGGMEHEQWFQIYNTRQESIGNMYVKVSHQELVVLTAEDYKPLSELLHKFSHGLTNQIANAMPQQLRKLAELFLNVFQVTNTSNEWLSALVEEEIDGLSSQKKGRQIKDFDDDQDLKGVRRNDWVRDKGKSLAGEANLLFRGNSLLTQALEFHMRRLGSAYLETTLTDIIFAINDKNPDCEVDVSRIAPGANVEEHWKALTYWAGEVWERIVPSVNNIPPELRHILKYVRAVAEDRYGGYLRTVTYTSVSGFFFLRFICPAILNPKLFGLLRDNPRPRAQRTLTLIAKGLQALGNLASFGKKETWMEPMNRFLNSHRHAFKEFIDAVCSISADRSSTPRPVTHNSAYTATVKRLGRISPNAREGFPSVPHLIDSPRNCAALVKLWLDSQGAQAAEKLYLEGELAEFHEICLGLQERSDKCVISMAEDVRKQPTAELAGLEKGSLMERGNMPYTVQQPQRPESDPYQAPGSSGSEDPASRDLKVNNSRESSSLRQVSDSSEASHAGGPLRRNGKKNFLSGLIGGKKDKKTGNHGQGYSSSSSARDKSRDNHDKGSRGNLRFPDSWHSGDSSRH